MIIKCVKVGSRLWADVMFEVFVCASARVAFKWGEGVDFICVYGGVRGAPPLFYVYR